MAKGNTKTASNEVMANVSAESIKTGDEATQAMQAEQKLLDERIAQRNADVQLFNATLETRPLEFERLESASLGDYVGSYELKDGTDETFQKAFYANLALFRQKQKDFKRAYSEMLSPLATMVNCEHYKKLQDKDMSKSPNMFIKNLLGCSKAYASNIKDVITKFYNKKGELKNTAFTVFSIGQLITLTKASEDALSTITDRYALACDELGKSKLTDGEFKRWLEVTENAIVLENLGIEPPKAKTDKKDKVETDSTPETDDTSETDSTTETTEETATQNDMDMSDSIIETNYKALFHAVASVMYMADQGYEFDFSVSQLIDFVLEGMLSEGDRQALDEVVESKADVSYPILADYIELVKTTQYVPVKVIEG